jgi:hypothetical protein
MIMTDYNGVYINSGAYFIGIRMVFLKIGIVIDHLDHFGVHTARDFQWFVSCDISYCQGDTNPQSTRVNWYRLICRDTKDDFFEATRPADYIKQKGSQLGLDYQFAIKPYL